MTLYVEPRRVHDVNSCTFYHSMYLPGYGFVEAIGTSAGGSRAETTPRSGAP